MMRSVRGHLNEEEFFSEYSQRPGGLEMVKKLEFFHFCQISAVFGHFNQYNHEKSIKIKVILEI